MTQDKQPKMLMYLLTGDKSGNNADDIRWLQQESGQAWGVLTARIDNRTAVQAADGELYIDADPHSDLFATRVDTTKRMHDYLLPERCRVVREVVIALPDGCSVAHLPAGLTLTVPQGVLSCSFAQRGRQLVFRKTMCIERPLVPRGEIPAWNEALHRWTEAAGEQIILTF